MNEYHVQLTQGADAAFDDMPLEDQRLFAESVLLALQANPQRGTAAHVVVASRSTPGLFHLPFGSSIVSYSIDPSTRVVRVSEFSY